MQRPCQSPTAASSRGLLPPQDVTLFRDCWVLPRRFTRAPGRGRRGGELRGGEFELIVAGLPIRNRQADRLPPVPCRPAQPDPRRLLDTGEHRLGLRVVAVTKE